MHSSSMWREASAPAEAHGKAVFLDTEDNVSSTEVNKQLIAE